MSLTMFKSILTTVVLAVAAAQALEMAQIKGYVHLLPMDKRRLRDLHRLGGVAVLFLMLVVALVCIISQGWALYSTRVLLHALLGTAALLVLGAKVLITNWFRRYLRINNGLGAAAGLLVLGVFVFSALWYFIKGY